MKQKSIPFNKPFLTGKELQYIEAAVKLGKISGDGEFTKRCHSFFQHKFRFEKNLLTSSCTDALEMCALLIDIKPGDEVIVPSYTFVSTATAFALRGAKLVFCDSDPQSPNMSLDHLSKIITPNTKAIVIVHYGGVAIDMDRLIEIINSSANKITIIEDAAHSIDSYFRNKPLGGIGDLGCFSFHETKNVISGEGGLLTVNNPLYSSRAEVIREKGTNRSSFFRGEVDKYNWVDIGSSFLPSEVTAAFLFAQLENIEEIQKKRTSLWQRYKNRLHDLPARYGIQVPTIPEYATANGHLFYIVCSSLEERTALIHHLRENGIHATFHYQALHISPFAKKNYASEPLPQAERYSDCLVRLPLFYDLDLSEVDYISDSVQNFFKINSK